MSKKYRQRGTYLHEWVCDCGHANSQGREPKSLGRKVGTWCPGCRRMKLVPVPVKLGGYIPCDADEIQRLKAENYKLRTLLGLAHDRDCLFYKDDGELQDNSQQPTIDFRRDSADEIQAKLIERAAAAYRKERG